MTSTAHLMFTLLHGATPGAGHASAWPQVELAQRIDDDAAGGV